MGILGDIRSHRKEGLNNENEILGIVWDSQRGGAQQLFVSA
jgi:hypothetical protein